MHGRDRHLVGVEAAPAVARAAVDGALQVDLADTLEVADEEGVDGHQIAGVMGLDVAFAELRAEAFQGLDLLLRQGEGTLGRDLLQAQQTVVPAEQAVAAPDTPNPGRADLDAGQSQLIGDPQRAMAGMGQAMVEDRLLDVLPDPVGMRWAGAGDLVEQPLGAIGLEVAADLVELLAAIAHYPTGLADVAEIGG